MLYMMYSCRLVYAWCLVFNDTATTRIYTYLHTLSLHDALPICIDRDTDVSLAIVDYKSGGAPSAKAAFDRLDNQLGLLGLIAQRGGMEKIAASPVTADRKSTRLNSSH